MRVTQSTIATQWPLDLVHRILERIIEAEEGIMLRHAVIQLVREVASAPAAFLDVEKLVPQVAGGWDSPHDDSGLRTWLDTAIRDQRLFQAAVRREYFAERHGAVQVSPAETGFPALVRRVVDLVNDLTEVGYFPEFRPRPCVDDDVDPNELNSTCQLLFQAAAGVGVEWPLQADKLISAGVPAVYSLVEFLGDHAKRPSVAVYHSWNDCGFDPKTFSRKSGLDVYQWKINEILAETGSQYRLAVESNDQLELVRSFGAELDSTIAEMVGEAPVSRRDSSRIEAVRLFRARGASMVEKKMAIAQLFKELELYREDVKDRLTKPVETELFHIANKFDIRHSKGEQKTDYDDLFLEWMFMTCLASLRMMLALKLRGENSAASSAQ